MVLKVRGHDSLLTKYPDRSQVVLSVAQKKSNRLFREAVAYAKELIQDPARNEELWKNLQANKKSRGKVYLSCCYTAVYERKF